jgi:hypothetical protein
MILLDMLFLIKYILSLICGFIKAFEQWSVRLLTYIYSLVIPGNKNMNILYGDSKNIFVENFYRIWNIEMALFPLRNN